jgi:anaerobic selenocysteine-containing dehydrogenase
MNSKPTLWGEIDAEGRLTLPPELVAQYGLQPGAKVRLESDGNRMQMHRPVTHLTKSTSSQPTCATSPAAPASATTGMMTAWGG